MFTFRTPRTFIQTLKALFWPRKGWLRPWQYIGIRILRSKGSVHEISAGIAAGVLGGLNPIYGVQMLTSGIAAVVLRGNIWVSMLASWVGNPFTYPAIWLLEWWVGRLILERQWPQDLLPDFAELFHNPHWADVWHLLKPMLVGYPIVAGTFALMFYVLSRPLVRHFRRKYPQFLHYSERHP